MHKQIARLADGRFVIAKFRNPQPLIEQLDATTADFSDYGDRCTLAQLGVFSVDCPKHSALRALEANRQRQIDADYAVLGLDRATIYRMVARKVQVDGLVPDGCWVTSTGAYAAGCAAEDEAVARWAAAVRDSAALSFEVIADPVVAATFRLEA